MIYYNSATESYITVNDSAEFNCPTYNMKFMDGTLLTQYSDGTLHYLFENGDSCVCKNDMLHSLLGPAKIFNNGQGKQWWINGVQLDCNTQEEFLDRVAKLKAFL
jgi:hypothetical protein